jgi:meso-butanediol dehydrogenase/(S,S)-butanediol dehydrogenase/diacetyl reductase
MLLKDQVAIVTGGGGGIGEGICLCLAREGAQVAVSDLNEELARKVSIKVKELGQKSLAVKTDVRFEGECNKLVEMTLKEFNRLDILVCAAGTSGVNWMTAPENPSAVENIPVEAWEMTLDVNLKGVFLCNRAVIPYFKQQRRGKIINVSSIGGRRGGTGLPAYSASKAGVINLTQSIALQVAPFNINANTICPGLVWTPMWAEGISFTTGKERWGKLQAQGVSPEEAFKRMVQTGTPLKRPQSPEDMGNLAVFLASDLAREITGQAINVDGGIVLS